MANYCVFLRNVLWEQFFYKVVVRCELVGTDFLGDSVCLFESQADLLIIALLEEWYLKHLNDTILICAKDSDLIIIKNYVFSRC